MGNSYVVFLLPGKLPSFADVRRVRQRGREGDLLEIVAHVVVELFGHDPQLHSATMTARWAENRVSKRQSAEQIERERERGTVKRVVSLMT